MSYPDTPPARLSSKPTHSDYHPCYPRVGVRIDGRERRDVIAYDVEAGTAELVAGIELLGEVEPFWRFAASRQHRRLCERFDAERGAPE